MPKKSSHILETGVGSKIFGWLLIEKNKGVSGYPLARMIYKDQYQAFPLVYKTLRDLKKMGLVYEIKESDKRGKLFKPNLENFFSEFNKLKMPEEYRLTEEEIKILSEWFSKEIDLKKIFEIKEEDKEEKFLSFAIVLQNLEERDILTIIAEFLAVGSYLSSFLELQKKKEDKKYPEIVDKTFELFYPFLKLPKEIREKLKNAEKSEIVDILIQFSILQINLLSDILNIKKSKK